MYSGLLISLLLAAPVPRDAKGSLRGWGEPVDPQKDCSFEVDRGGQLTITVPQTHELNEALGHMNAPRVLRDIEGDFKIEVTVEAKAPNGSKTTVPSRPPYFCCGLIVAVDDKTYLRLEKTWIDQPAVVCYACFEVWQHGKQVVSGSLPGNTIDPVKPTQLRILRDPKGFNWQFREGTGEWKAHEYTNASFGTKLKAGSIAANTSDREFKATFRDFLLEKP